MSGPLQLIELPAARLREAAALGAEFYREGKLPGLFDPVAFVQTWQGLLATGQGVLWALDAGGRLIGGLGAILYPDPNDGALVATEMFWYVTPEARGAGLRLLRRFESWAAESGAQRMIMVHLTGLQPEELARLYERRGYKPVEVHYLKEI